MLIKSLQIVFVFGAALSSPVESCTASRCVHSVCHDQKPMKYERVLICATLDIHLMHS